jgi:hypothetical protein
MKEKILQNLMDLRQEWETAAADQGKDIRTMKASFPMIFNDFINCLELSDIDRIKVTRWKNVKPIEVA